MQKKETSKQTYWVGIDWGETDHAATVVDSHRNVLKRFRVKNDLDGFKELGAVLRAFDSIGGIAIEACRQPLALFLVEQGWTVFPINPKLSKNWRAGNSVAGNKSDDRDGTTLALELSRRHESLRCVETEAPEVAKLMGLSKKQRALIDQRTALLQQLKACLKTYYPAGLRFFSDFTSPSAWKFIKRFPNPEVLARARKDTLIRFLRSCKIGLRPCWLERIENRDKALEWPSPDDAYAEQSLALALVAQLQALQPHIVKFDRLIQEQAQALAQNKLIESLPGAGERLAPALTAIFSGVAARGANGAASVRCLGGVAPVEDQSGKRRRAHIRRRCNKHWRNIFHLFAHCSKQSCPWAKAFYRLCKQRGDTHATALRKLADKWIRIIARMVETGQPYDDGRYVQALRRNNSPVYQILRGQFGG